MDRYLIRVGYTNENIVGLLISQCLPCPLATWSVSLRVAILLNQSCHIRLFALYVVEFPEGMLFNIPVPNSYGPIARDVESLAIAMKALTVDSTMYEVAPATPPVPFRSQVLLYRFSSVLVQVLTTQTLLFQHAGQCTW